MTMEALRAFATHCRQLERITLNIDGGTVVLLDEDADWDENGPNVQVTLSFLDVGVSPIHDVEQVALFLAPLFPNLRGIYCQERRWEWYEQDEVVARAQLHSRLWQTVEAVLRGSYTAEQDAEEFWAILFFVLYQAESEFQYIVIEAVPEVVGFVNTLIHTRVGLGWTSEQMQMTGIPGGFSAKAKSLAGSEV
ncbi:hypothetical protein FB45DRAFT_1052344 [Roridomyces roridus]|uniref:Uncharacterized protein n=1 Tax=Roridomyces roridus TaxID=1738132 RepID=A0AAD7CGC7_9AGAR|nr:hypothetical protein FB45DRAFT_1052344 [Roridomyces roridus]